MSESVEDQKDTFFSQAFVRSLAQDLLVFGALFGMFAWPLINLSILQPQNVLSQRLEKLEAAHEQTRQNLTSIDKNMAVLAESTKRTDEALQAIRTYLTKEDR